MFDAISNSLSKVFDSFSGKKFISEDDLNLALREIRVALLTADVSLSVAKDFIAKIREKALGEEVVKSVSPGQMIVKIVYDQ
jgi:signal recognition particle subunit SRP54